MNGSCRLHDMSAPAAMTPTSTAATIVASHIRRSSQSQTATTPTPASAGIANPNVINRSAGNHPVSSPTGAPTITSAVQAASTRRAKPFVRISPSAANGSASHCTYRVQRCSARSRYAWRTASGMPARRRNPSFDVSTARRAGPIVIANRPPATIAPPPSVARATRPASLRQPRSRRASDHAATPANTSAPIRKNCGCARPPPPSAIAARTVPRVVPSARPIAAPTNGAANARFARYPAARWTVNSPASSPARTHAARTPRRSPVMAPAARTSIATPAPIAAPNAASNPAVIAATRRCVTPANTAKSAGLPGRSPTTDSPCDAPTRVHQR